MFSAPIPDDDSGRVATLHSYGILDTLPEQGYEDVTSLAISICSVPYSTVTFIDRDRQWFKSQSGLGNNETNRSDGFCACAILQPQPMIVEDTLLDPRFAENPFVLGGPCIRFYAGAPIVAPNGHILGTVCVFDDKPRQIAPAQIAALEALARQVMALLEQRKTIAQLQEAILNAQASDRILKENERRLQIFVDSLPTLAWTANADGWITWYNRRWYEYTGTTPQEMAGWGWQSVHDPQMLPLVVERWTTSIRNQKPFEMIFPLRGADGVFRSYMTRIVPLRDETGTVVQWFGTNTEVDELQRTRQALEASEAGLNQVMTATTDAVVSINREWVITYLNPVGERLYGATKDLVGRNLWEAFPDAIYEGSPFVEHYYRAMDQGIAGSLEAEYGDPLNLFLRLEVYPTPDGIVTFSRDISEKRRAEEILAQREKQLALAVEAADLAAWYYDPNTKLAGGDEKMRQIFGLSAAVCPMEVWIEAIHEQDRERVRGEFADALTGSPYDTEFRIRRVDGTVRWVRCKAQMLTAGGISHMVGIYEDITDRKRVDEALRDTAERLSMAQQTGKMAAWQWDLYTGNFIWDEGTEWTWGRPQSEMRHANTIFSYIHEEDRERVAEDLRPASEDAGVCRSEFRVVWPDGTLHWIQAFGKAVPSSDGQPVCVVGINIDVTERKLAEMALIQTEKLAAVGRLASSIAHEINNPLEAITNLLYLARTTDDMSEIRVYLQTADGELRRTSAIANQTLRFHKQSTKPIPVTCSDLIGSVLGVHQARLANAEIEVEKRKRANTPVLCFDGEIRQVISNLVGNAIDAMSGDGGRLLMRSREAHDWATGRFGLVITVADTGPGMEKSTLEKLFNAFFTTKGIGGTGLGLWISKEILDRHHGRLLVRSSQRNGHKGTVFTVFLPFDAVVR